MAILFNTAVMPGTYTAAVNVVDESPEHHDELITRQPGRLDTQDTNFPAGEINDSPHGADPTAKDRIREGATDDDDEADPIDIEAERGFNLSDLTERQTNVPNKMNPYRDWSESYSSWNQYEDPMDKMGHSEENQPVAAVDLDGTLLEPIDYDLEPLASGQPVLMPVQDGAASAMDALRELGWKVIIWTARFSKAESPEQRDAYHAEIELHLQQNQITFDSIATGPKPIADAYIDDHAIRFEGDWYATLRELTMQSTEKMGPADYKPEPEPEYDKEGVALIDTVDNPNDWTDVDGQRRDLSIPRPPDTERMKYSR